MTSEDYNDQEHGAPRADLSRRRFLQAGSIAAGTLVLGFTLPDKGRARAAKRQATTQFSPNAFIRIGSDGAIDLIIDKCEVGQGVYTSFAMLLAEELEVPLEHVNLVPAPPDDKLYADPILHFQATGNSSSVRGSWQRLRSAGAAARSLLITAAANQWHVKPDDCIAEQGRIVHTASKRSLSYAELVPAAARLPVPEQVTLKDPKDFKLLGTSPLRLDLPGKVNGQTQYTIDVRLPGMKIASTRTCPVLGGTVARVDDTRALRIQGVRKVVGLRDAVAVIADHTWAAMQGLAALDIDWNEGPHANLQSRDIVGRLAAAAERTGVLAKAEGDTAKAMSTASKRLEAVYQDPFLAHAAMEPMTCVAHVRPDGCELWVATQVQARAQQTAAALTKLPLEKIIVHNLLAGSAFGRRLETDFIAQAVEIAMQFDAPIKLTWSREEDVRRDMYRPYYYDKISAGLDAQGLPSAWMHRIVGSSVMARFAPPALGPNGLDPDAVECAAQPPYDFPNFHVDYVREEPPAIPTAFWRGVGPTHNVYVLESFIDECAAAVKQDAVQYRLALLKKTPRAANVLKLAASKANWGSALPARSGRGVAVVYVFDTYLAIVAQVTVAVSGQVNVESVVCAVDCGMTVHPDSIVAQIEGGVLFGLTGALYDEITVRNGRIEQSNFNDYRTMRMDEAPPVEVHIVPSNDAPGGIGETGTVGAAPALTNAIFAATGVRIRKLPVRNYDLRAT